MKSGELWIKTKSGEIKQFFPNYAQNIIIERIEKKLNENRPVRIRLLKARQVGFSTLFEAIIYAFTSRREGFNSLVIADDDSGSKKLFEMNKLFHDRLNTDFRPEIKKSNEIALEFLGLNSRIDIDTSRNKNAGRGDTYQIIHKSETSRFPYPKEVNLGIANSVPDLPGTMIFDESTANGMNDYYDDCNKAKSGQDGYEFVFIPWFYDEGYKMPAYDGFARTEEENEIAANAKSLYEFVLTDEQIQWRRYAIIHKCGGDKRLFKQEYPSNPEEAFLVSGRPRFDIDALKILKSKCLKPIRAQGLLDIYDEPNILHEYVLGVDTSEGLITGDSSSVCILNAVDFSLVAEYNGKLEPDILAEYLAEWGVLYNKALIVVEDNNHGLAVLNELKKIYFNIYYRKQLDHITNEWTRTIGWRTSARTKPILISNLDKALRDGLRIPSENVISELMTYVIEDDGGTNASQGKHDDRVISLACSVQGYLESIHEAKKVDKPLPRYCAPMDKDLEALMENA